MNVSDDNYRAFYKRVFADEEFNSPSGVLNEAKMKKALFVHVGASDSRYTGLAYKLATEWFGSHRSMHERLGLFFDIMRLREETEHE